MNIAAVEVILKVENRVTKQEMFVGTKSGLYATLKSLKERNSPCLKSIDWKKLRADLRAA